MEQIFNRPTEKKLRRRLRRSMTEAEVILWSQLKGRKIGGHKFRRQYSVGPFVVDFYCAEKKLAIEVDGESHSWRGAQEQDVERQKWIEQFGIRFLRFANEDVRWNLHDVLESIGDAVSDRRGTRSQR